MDMNFSLGGRLSVTKIFRFEMAHALPDYDGPCAHLHGHSYRLEVTLSTGNTAINSCQSAVAGPGEGPLREVETGRPGAVAGSTEGMVMDFSQLKRMVEETIIAQVDHALVLDERMEPALIAALRKINTKLVLTPFTPTSENMLLWFAQTLADAIAKRADWTARGLRLQRLRLYETATSFAEWENTL